MNGVMIKVILVHGLFKFKAEQVLVIPVVLVNNVALMVVVDHVGHAHLENNVPLTELVQAINFKE